MQILRGKLISQGLEQLRINLCDLEATKAAGRFNIESIGEGTRAVLWPLQSESANYVI